MKLLHRFMYSRGSINFSDSAFNWLQQPAALEMTKMLFRNCSFHKEVAEFIVVDIKTRFLTAVARRRDRRARGTTRNQYRRYHDCEFVCSKLAAPHFFIASWHLSLAVLRRMACDKMQDLVTVLVWFLSI